MARSKKAKKAGNAGYTPFTAAMEELIRRDLCFGIRERSAPCTVIDGRRVTLCEVMAFLLHYYCPPDRICHVLDPTCGRENYQFRCLKPIMENEHVVYVDGDIGPWGSYQGDVFRLPFRDCCFDVVVYDPPFRPTRPGLTDARSPALVPESVRGPEDVKRFYSREALSELARVTRPGGVVIVKGQDFYHPLKSRNLHLFLTDIFDPRQHPQLRPEALFIYLYYQGNRHDLQRRRIAGYGRPMVCHSYFVVLRRTAE